MSSHVSDDSQLPEKPSELDEELADEELSRAQRALVRSSQPERIPTFIMEEHHEAFLIWNHALAKGWLSESGNFLLHVDEHPDMTPPHLRSPVREVVRRREECQRFAYQELDIASFIVPAFYQGIFSRHHWVRQGSADRAGARTLQVYSLDGDGRRLAMSLSVETAGGARNPDRRAVVSVHQTEAEPLPKSSEPVVLDIDLDYFSCIADAGETVELEVTERQYREFLADPYHPLHNHKGPWIAAREREGQFFLWLGAMPPEHAPPERLKVSDEEVLRRIANFKEFLRRNHVQPCLIDICRSRRSGYTPADQWELIERTLLAALTDLYPMELYTVSELADPCKALAAPVLPPSADRAW